MKTHAAVLWDRHKEWSFEEIELDPPKSGRCSSPWRAAACVIRTNTS
jgi:Zn-dependent alcohol dehydrogenase